MLLISGCSFVDNPHFLPLAWGIDVYAPDRTRSVARSGAGNQYIARSIMENLTVTYTTSERENQQARVDRVFVLWSGLSRIDVPLPLDQEFEIEEFWHRQRINRTTWYLSGGAEGLWNMNTTGSPEFIRQYLKRQYMTYDWEYLATHSLSHVVGCLAMLEAQGIDYRFGFIHDIFQDHSDEPSLGGAVSRENPMVALIPWHRCLSSSPYDFCRSRGMLSEDNFHPSPEGYQAWIEDIRHLLPAY